MLPNARRARWCCAAASLLVASLAAPVEAAPPRRAPAGMARHGLAGVGALELRSLDSRAGVRASVQRLGEVYWLGLEPLFAWTDADDGDPALLVTIPLRFELLDTRGASTDERFGDLFGFREADWASPWDAVRSLELFRVGTPDDPVNLEVSAFTPLTLGHGTWVRHYNPALSVSGRKLSVQLGARAPVGEVTLLASDPFDPRVLGAHVAVHPAFGAAGLWSRLALTGTVAADVDAPMMNRLDRLDADRDGRRDEILLTGPADRPAYVDGVVVAWSTGLALTPAESGLGWSAFAELGGLSGPEPLPCGAWDGAQADRCPGAFGDAGDPFAEQPTELETRRVGALGGVVGAEHRAATDSAGGRLLTRLEARLGEPGAHFRYFDVLYPLQRVVYRAVGDAAAESLAGVTKARAVVGKAGDLVPALAAEAHWRTGSGFELAGGVDAAFGAPHGGWFLHVGMPSGAPVGWFVAYHKRASAAAELASVGEGAVLVGAARATLVPILHLNARALVPLDVGGGALEDRLFDVTLGLELSFAY